MLEPARAVRKERVKKDLAISLCVVSLCILVSGCGKRKDAPALSFGTAISADGVPIQYEVRGKGAPALVFVHGWCCDRSYWSAQLPYFARDHLVVAIDLAGHGESGLDRKEWTMGSFGEDIVAVVRKLGLDQVVLIGHSMGGPAVIEAARRLPGGVMGLVVADFLQDFERQYSQEFIDGWIDSLKPDYAAAVKKFVAEALFTKTSDPVLVEKIAEDMSSAPPGIAIGAIRGEFAFLNDLTRIVKEVRAPITCINSDSDVWPTRTEVNRRYAPSFKAKIMSGVGHFNMIEAPCIFNGLLEDSVKEYERNAAKK
jgi:pimeloyl-ACP methyl ester carboxylesterase